MLSGILNTKGALFCNVRVPNSYEIWYPLYLKNVLIDKIYDQSFNFSQHLFFKGAIFVTDRNTFSFGFSEFGLQSFQTFFLLPDFSRIVFIFTIVFVFKLKIILTSQELILEVYCKKQDFLLSRCRKGLVSLF